MSVFDLIAENQIQDWNRRKAEGKIPENAPEPTKRTSFESQLFTAIVDYYKQAVKHAPESIKRQQIERQAENLRIQLMITLERNDMRHTAQFLTVELQKRRDEMNATPPSD